MKTTNKVIDYEEYVKQVNLNAELSASMQKQRAKLELEAQRYFDLLMDVTQEVSNLYEIINQIELLLDEKGYTDVLEELDKLRGDTHVR